MTIFFIILLLISISSFIFALKKSKNNQFYSDTHLLAPLGIYVWGDGLVLAPFWMIVSLLALLQSLFIKYADSSSNISAISPLQAFKFFVLFHTVRSAYEVIYWLNHQSVKDDYDPPLFRNIKCLRPQESAILYQLIHMGVIVIGVSFLITTH